MGWARDPGATVRLSTHSCATHTNGHSSQDTGQDPSVATAAERNPGSHLRGWGEGGGILAAIYGAGGKAGGVRLHKLSHTCS